MAFGKVFAAGFFILASRFVSAAGAHPARVSAIGEETPPQSRQEFCDRAGDQDFPKRLLAEPSNRIFSTNMGGLLNKGVCWWHSRMQRSAVHLAVFRPDLQKPTKREVWQIFSALARNKRVLEIPGYSNFYTFTLAYAFELQDFLDAWQTYDTAVHGAWLRGLRGRSDLAPEKLHAKMDSLFNEVEVKGRVVYQKLQLPGIAAHAWLVFSMEELSDGYKLSVIDSNSRSVENYEYKVGMTHFTLNHFRKPFVPYIEHTRDFESFDSAIAAYCSPEYMSFDFDLLKTNSYF